MQPQQFRLVISGHPQMAIQAGPRDGTPVSLQTLHPANGLQLWIMQAQVADGFQGVAFVNPQTGNSVTYNGERQPLLMQPFSPGSSDIDAWSVIPGDGGNVRIAFVKDNTWSWNDWGGHAAPNDPIALGHDHGWNSLWRIQLVTGAELAATDAGGTPAAIAVPSIAGEPAAAAV